MRDLKALLWSSDATEGQTPPSMFIVDGDPDGVLEAGEGSIAVDPATGAEYIKTTTDATSWSAVSGGGGGLTPIADGTVLGNFSGSAAIPTAQTMSTLAAEVGQAIGDLPAASGQTSTDLVAFERDPAGTPQTQKITLQQLVTAGFRAPLVTILTVADNGSSPFVPRAGTKTMRVRLLGGGGGAGGGSASAGNYSVASGAQAGSYVEHLYDTIAASYAFAVGAGGTGSVLFPTVGGNTTFGSLTATGGAIGQAGTNAIAAGLQLTPNLLALGTAPSGGNIANAYGQPGQPGVIDLDGGFVSGGAGGSTFMGSGTPGDGSGSILPTGYGAGGTGGEGLEANGPGTDGAEGVIVIEEWG